MMRMVLAVALVFGVLVPQAHADWEYTKWGMTPEQVVRASKGSVRIVPVADRYKNDDGWEIAVQGPFNTGGLRVDLGFTFDIKSGGLRCVLGNVLGDQAAGLKALLVKQLGPPKESGDFLGAETLAWETPDRVGLVIGRKPVAAVMEYCSP